MYYDNIDLNRTRLHLHDRQLLGLVKQRFKLFTDSYRIENNVVEVYNRPDNSIMFSWNPCKDQSLEMFAKVGRVYSLLKSLEECMKEIDS